MYTLYGYPKTRSVRVAWALEELGLPYDYEAVDLKAGEHLSDTFKALTPSAKIPVLVTPDGALSESAAIVTFLAEKHGMHEFIPEPASFMRAKYEQVMVFLVSELEQPLWSMAKHTFALPEAQRIPQMLHTAQWEFAKALNAFSLMLADNEFVCGNTFTMADVIAGHVLSWARGSKQDLAYDNVKAYAERILSRPAYEKAWRRETASLASKSSD